MTSGEPNNIFNCLVLALKMPQLLQTSIIRYQKGYDEDDKSKRDDLIRNQILAC